MARPDPGPGRTPSTPRRGHGQRLQSFLLRHGRRYPRSHVLGKAHARWLAEQRFAHPGQQVAFEEYGEAVREATRRVERLDQQIRTWLPTWSMAPVVQAPRPTAGFAVVGAPSRRSSGRDAPSTGL